MLTLLVLVVVAAAWVVDRVDQGHEFTALTACVRSGERAGIDADARLDETTASINPAITAGVSPATEQTLFHLVAVAAAPAQAELRRARSRCGGVTIREVHGSLVDARDSYLRYLDARLAYVGAVRSDGSQAYEPAVDVAGLRAHAAKALRAAAATAHARRAASLVLPS